MLTKAAVKLVRSLATHKGRRQTGLFVAEGPKLVGELLGHLECRGIFALDTWQSPAGTPAVERVNADELQRISLQQAPQQVVAIFRIPHYDFDFASVAQQRLVLALDDVQDPGNVGTIVRLADWFGVTDVVCSTGTADLWNPKTIQATMGAAARVHVHTVPDLAEAIASLPAGVPVCGTLLGGDNIYEAATLPATGVLVMGNEGNGISPAVEALCTQRLLIPNYPPGRSTTESLNVAMATAITLAEFRRRALLLCIAVGALLLASCQPTRFLAPDEYMLDHVSVRADKAALSTTSLNGYIRQQPNARWFSLLKVPLGIYSLSPTDTTRTAGRLFRKLGEAPVRYDSVQTERSRRDIEAAVRNLGYLGADVSVEPDYHRRRVDITYNIHTGARYHVSSIERDVDDAAIDSAITANWHKSYLAEGMAFDVNELDRERSRITSQLQNDGYYRFSKSYVRFQADTTIGNHTVALALSIPRYRASQRDSLRNHVQYHVGRVNFLTDVDIQDVPQYNARADSMHLFAQLFYPRRKLPLHPVFIINKTMLRPGKLFRESDVQSTYSNLSSLSAVMGTSVTFEPSPTAPDTIDAFITLRTARRHSVTAEVEGTNSAGDLGMALRVGYQNRNLFHRSAQLALELRGAYEAIRGLEGYSDQDYTEFSTELNLNFPELIFPFIPWTYRRSIKGQSIASLLYDSQDRPEFHRRVLTASWRYRWSRFSLKHQHRVDMLDLNYVFMPWISDTFRKEYLADNTSRNAILRYNYENLFIMKWGYTFSYTSVPPTSQNVVYGKNAYSIRFGVETAGNLLYGLSHLLHAQYSDNLGTYTLFNIAYAEYARFDFDWVKSIRMDARNSLALHFALGTAVPYGNSSILPYEKRYFSGGANSVRGWAVRGLGPGSFSGSDGRVDFIRQTGDIKLDMSAEWRTHMFWKMDGAAFIDAGNIWTLRAYDEQPGGQFRPERFWKQIAVAYGLGLRLNFSYFIIRVDGGMKALNPAVESGAGHYPLLHPRIRRDLQLHFAVGLPF